MTKREAIELYSAIRDIKNGNLSREAMVKYVMLRVKLRGVADEFEKAREEVSEQTKPEGWKEGHSTKKWDEAFRPVIEKWLSEEVDIDSRIFDQEECVDLIMSNPDKDGLFGDVIVQYLGK